MFYDKDELDKDLETGYFVVKDVESAQHLIKLENENVIGFDFTFHVEPVEDLDNDPLSK